MDIFTVERADPAAREQAWEEHGWGLGWQAVALLVAAVLALSFATHFLG